MIDPLVKLRNVPVNFDPWARNRLAEKRAHRDDFWERLGDSYISLLTAALVFAYAAGLSLAFADQLRSAADGGMLRTGLGVVPGESATSALVMLGLFGVLLLISRLGPVAVDRAQGFWWLSLPVDRTGFLSRLLLHRLISTFLLGSFLWLPIGYGSVLAGLALGSTIGVFLGAATLGMLFVVLSLLVAWIQTCGWGENFRTVLNLASMGVLLAYLVDVLLRLTATGNIEHFWLLLPSRLPVLAQAGTWWIPVVLGILALAGFAALAGRLQRIPSAELISRGANSAHAGAALALLDDKSLGSALNNNGSKDSVRVLAARARNRKRGGDVFSRILPATLVRGPYTALIRAELLILLRSGKTWRGLLVSWCVPVAGVFAVQGTSGVVLACLVAIGAILAGKAASSAAAQAADVASLESIIPLNRSAVRQTHAVVAALLLLPWGIGLASFLGWAMQTDTTTGSLILLVLGALTGIGLAAGAVRLSFRPALDWGSVLLMAAMGNAVGPIIQHLVYGYDVMVLSVIALLAGLFLVPVPPMLILLAAVVAAIAWGVGTWTSDPSKGQRSQS